MGRYIEWDDVNNRYPSIARVGGSEEVDAAHIVYAENEIDGLLSGIFSTPFSSNNMTAKDLAIDLTYIKIGNLKSEAAKELRETFMDRINRLKEGEELMILEDGTAIDRIDGTVWSSTQNYHPTFGMGNELEFAVDSQQTIDEEDARL